MEVIDENDNAGCLMTIVMMVMRFVEEDSNDDTRCFVKLIRNLVSPGAAFFFCLACFQIASKALAARFESVLRTPQERPETAPITPP